MADEYVMDAWYRCPVHGDVHHPKGPDTEHPCPECEPSSLPFKSMKQFYDELGESERFKRVLDEAMGAAGIDVAALPKSVAQKEGDG